MLSDNENPGAEISAGQSATAATPAPENLTATVEPEAKTPAPADVQVTPPAPAPFAAEPAAVTVAPVEPVAAPDGAAAVEHSDVSEALAVDAGEPSTESTSEMEQLMEQYAAPHQAPAEGEIESGQVVAITDLGVVVDLGGKTEGLIPAQEFAELDGPFPLVAGQPVEVQRTGDRKDGMVLLSYQRVRRRRAWSKIEEAYRNKTDITAKVVDHIKGGLVVDIGVRAFLPASQIELRPVHDLDGFKDQEIELRVLKLNRKRGNVVVSRRVILEDDQKSKRDSLMSTLSEGSIVTGKVKNITDYGVFVDLGGMDGLLHVSDLVWGRVPHPSSVVQAGEEIEVQILKFDKDKQRISLGRKQLLPDPWATVPERFPTGTRVQGKIVGVTDYGAFVQIEPGVEGLVHVSEMSWSKRTKHPSKIVKVGEEVDVVVLDVKTDQRRISLGLKQTLPDPWGAAAEKYPVGTVVTGRIRNLADFGAFVEIEEGMEGLIHISDMSWTERIKHPSDRFKKGDSVQAKVLKVDSQNRRLSLGIKQVNDIWANWFAEHKIGDVIRGKVARTTDFGAFVELAEGIEGLCHVSEIEERKPKGERDKEKGPRGARVTSVLAAGQEHDFKILRLEPEQHKISLSYRAAQKQVERQEIEAYRAPKPSPSPSPKASPKSSPNATIGDAILAKRQSS